MFLATEPAAAAGAGAAKDSTAGALSSTLPSTLLIHIRDDWRIANVRELSQALDTLEPALHSPDGVPQRLRVDFSGLRSMDISSAWLLQQRLEALQAAGRQVELDSPPEHFAFIEDMRRNGATSADGPPPTARLAYPLSAPASWAGHRVVRRLRNALHGLEFFGRLVMTALIAMGSWRRLRVPSIVRHVYETGIEAVPIVSLIAFLISIIVAYLGQQQLKKFGAEIFTVDLVSIAVLREMGVLLTAIIVAGRSGSAFAAEIGVMKLNEEVDALRSIGFDPFEVLVLPRVLALLIALPLLTVVADAMGLLGGGILSALLIDIRPEQYISRVQDALAPTTFWAGLIKAPIFAVIIALVGTQRGMEVRDSSRELGRLTTMAVVQSIFMVIFADAVFAILFVQLDF